MTSSSSVSAPRPLEHINEQHRAVIDRCAEQFRKEISEWQTFPKKKDSPLIDEQTRQLLYSGFCGVLEAFDKLQPDMFERGKGADLEKIAWQGPMNRLKDELGFHASSTGIPLDTGRLIEATLDRAIRASFLYRYAERFRQEMGAWRFDRKNTDSPLLDNEMKNLLISGMCDMVEGFERIPKADKTWQNSEELRKTFSSPVPPELHGLIEPEMYASMNEDEQKKSFLGLVGDVPAHALHCRLVEHPQIMALPAGKKDDTIRGLMGSCIERALDAYWQLTGKVAGINPKHFHRLDGGGPLYTR